MCVRAALLTLACNIGLLPRSTAAQLHYCATAQLQCMVAHRYRDAYPLIQDKINELQGKFFKETAGRNPP